MGLYHPGVNDAVARVEKMSRAELLAHIDRLYGRDNLRFEATDDDIRAEAIEQTRRDFTNCSDPGWEMVEFFKRYHANHRGA
jgi:hypothetical protein